MSGAGTKDARDWHSLSPALSEWIHQAISSMGFARMTPVQASTIPLFMGNKDVVVEAVTGSGKTLSFLIPVLERLLKLDEPLKRHHVGAIILSPTRELATQIHSVLLSLLSFHAPSAAHLKLAQDSESDQEQDSTPIPVFPSSTLKVNPQLLLGGTTTPAQDLAQFLKDSPNLLISTPGRLLELLSSPHVHCPQNSFEVLVLDEADRLLDLGFKEDLSKILTRLPKQRRTGLFSASVSEAVDQLVRVGLRNPVRVAVKVKGVDGKGDQKTPASLKMTYHTTKAEAKLPTLLRLLQTLNPTPMKSIAYVSTCAAVDYLQHILPSIIPLTAPPHRTTTPITLIPLHGKHTPAIRHKNFKRFLETPTPCILLTTDVAARGLDIPAVDLTVQLDPPSDPKTFIHRAGRAGRAGRRGLATVFLLPGREADEYPRFLAVRKSPVTPLAEIPALSSYSHALEIDDTILEQCIQRMRATVLSDRALHDKAQRAFVSWVQSYAKHAAKGIFQTDELPWRALAEGWALLRLPKMPELKRSRLTKEETLLDVEVKWDEYAYRDKEREKKRRAEQAEYAAGRGQTAAKIKGKMRKDKEKAWSSITEQKDVKRERREKKSARRAAVESAGMTADEKRKQAELQSMIEEVRRRNLAPASTTGAAKGSDDGDVEFTGFDD